MAITIAEVRDRVEKLRADQDNNESAHVEEDNLWGDVLLAIAEGAPDAAALATEALKTSEICFERWYA